MRSFKFISLLAVVLLALASCSQLQVKAGHVGIIVDQYGSGSGVEQQVVGVGYHSLGWNQQGYDYPIYKIQYQFKNNGKEGVDESIPFQSKEGVKCSADVAIQVQVENDNKSIINLFTSYREDIETVVHTQVHNRLRDYMGLYASKMTVDDLYGNKRFDMLIDVTKALADEFSKQGLIIDNLSFLGVVEFPETIKSAIDAKMAATQKAQQRDNEIATAQASAAIQVTQAKGEADSNRILAASISPEILKLKELQNQEKFIEALSTGKATMPTTYVAGGSNSQTFIPLK